MVTQTLLDLVKSSEGCKLTAYPDPATGSDPWTIGYGATGDGIHEGVQWTQEQADTDLENRLQDLQTRIMKIVPEECNQNQLDALTDFAYNLGLHALANSTLLKKFNAGDTPGAAAQFMLWTKADGKVMPGLVTRREKERDLFLS